MGIVLKGVDGRAKLRIIQLYRLLVFQQAAANLFDEAFTTGYNKNLSSKLVAKSEILSK